LNAAVEDQVAGNLYPGSFHMEKCLMRQKKTLKQMILRGEDDLDQDDLDMFEGDDSFEDFGFEEIGIKTVKNKNQEPGKDCSIVFNLGSSK
jgi:hypothetical protein